MIIQKCYGHSVHATQTKDPTLKGIQSHTDATEQRWAAPKWAHPV